MTSRYRHLKPIEQIMFIVCSTLALSYLSLHVRAKSIPSFAGPFVVVLREIVDCPEDQSGLNLIQTTGIITHNQRNSSQDKVFNGVFYLFLPFDDSLVAQVSFAGWNSVSGWMQNSFHFTFKRSCNSLFTLGKEVAHGILRYCKERPAIHCPVAKNNYTVENLPTAFRLKSFPAFHYGKWKVLVQLYQKEKATQKDVLAACIQVESQTVPPEYVRQKILDL